MEAAHFAATLASSEEGRGGSGAGEEGEWGFSWKKRA